MSNAGLVGAFDAVLLDLDGVIYRGPEPINNAATTVAQLPGLGIKCAFVTNNSSRTPDEVVAALDRVGVQAEPDQIVSSAQAAAAHLSGICAPDDSVLVVGGEGLWQALVEVGLRPTRSLGDDPVAVVQGFHPDVGWRDLANAAYAVSAGAIWVASNADMTLPTERGLAPGNGSLVQAVANATGTEAVVVGKPFPPTIIEAVRRLSSQKPLVVGDRLDTDIEAATNTGIPSLLVLTGVTTVADLALASIDRRPTYIGADLLTLTSNYRAPTVDNERVTIADWTFSIGSRSPQLVSSGTDPILGVRGLASACWRINQPELTGESLELAHRLQEAIFLA